MYWRLPQAQFLAQKGEGTKQAFQQVVESGEIVRLLACVKGQPMVWCAIALRKSYPMLERSRILKRVDEASGGRVIEGYPIEPKRTHMPALRALQSTSSSQFLVSVLYSVSASTDGVHGQGDDLS
jgi:hypothetical protein